MTLLHATVFLTAAAFTTASAIAAPKAENLPVNELRTSKPISEWLIVGTFPNPDAIPPLPDGTPRSGMITDYLALIGGESQPNLSPSAMIPFTDASGASATASVTEVTADPGGVVNLLSVYPGRTNVVAYAVTQVRVSRETETIAFFGSDDWAKVWVNGDLVHNITGPGGRGTVPRQDQFPIKLRKGLNTIVAKIDQADGAWSFILEVLTPADAKAHADRQKRIRQVRRAQDTSIAPEIIWNYVFGPGDFPKVDWKEPERIAAVWGEVPLTVRWFDGQLNEVVRAEKPGRYIAYAEGSLPDGMKIRRAATFYCAPADFDPWTNPPRMEMPFLDGAGVDPAVWNEFSEDFSRVGSSILLDRIFTTEDGPILLAGLFESKPLGRKPTQLDRPDMAFQDINLGLKMKVLGKQPAMLRMPRAKNGAPSTVLHAGTPADADMVADAARKMGAAAQAWYDDAKIPLTVMVARHGVIVLHDAYGSTPERPVTTGTKLPLASLTKTHAGLLLAQFIDQGLISLDDPVGKYLPDFPTTGPKVLTIRHCVTHTSGLEGHGEWRGMMNPWLDNVIANGLETLTPGETYLYNGMGFDLAGKVMEVVSGKSIFRLFHENFFQPLGQDNPTIEDLGYGIDCTVEDLARVGQMMLNKGSYGSTEFFSVSTFENQVTPRPLKEFFPKLRNNQEDRYNLGMHYATDGSPDAPILGRNTLMHGAATGAVLRVDYDHDLVVAVCRSTPGPRYDANLQALLRAVADSLLPEN